MRMALGAQIRDVLRLVVVKAIRPTLLGIRLSVRRLMWQTRRASRTRSNSFGSRFSGRSAIRRLPVPLDLRQSCHDWLGAAMAGGR